MILTMGEVAGLLGTRASSPEVRISAYSIDSRTIGPGALFFAIRGPRLNGHDFVISALERGAAAAVVESEYTRRVPESVAAKLLAVEHTTQALQQLARAVRSRWAKHIIAVTGSTGKTTTKELIAALLQPSFKVHRSPGNLNNEFGVPLTLLRLEPEHDVAVMELAMSAPGEIARLARLCDPEIGVVTNVAPAHLEFFDSLDGIANAKRELIENLKQSAIAVLNYDDPRVRRFAEGFGGKVVTFGLGEGAQFRALHLRPNVVRNARIVSEFRVEGPDFSAEFILPQPGQHNIQNALAAIATARLFEVPVDELLPALASFETLHQRGEVISMPSSVTLINDSYNSNPLAVECMLETLAGWPGAKRRIVVAGEMLELGPTSPDLHRQVGRKCAERGIDWLVGVQGDAAYFVEGAIGAGMPPGQTRFFSAAEEAGRFCQNLLKPLDVVLIKGSRGVHLERVVELLAASAAGNLDSETASPVVH